jgi:hypothetical protein
VTAHLLVALALLVAPAVLPALALLGARTTTVFITPLVGAVLAAIAAELEAAIGSTLLTWYVILAVLANVAALAGLRQRFMASWKAQRTRLQAPGGGGPRGWAWPSWWSLATVAVMAFAAAWPLQVLRTPILGYDGFAIWTLHSLFMYGGHSVYHGALTDPVYRFSNPNYPPLVPATGALGFVAEGGVDLRLAAILTAVLNACALAAAGCAIAASTALDGRALARVVGLGAGACVCLIGFGLSGSIGVSGNADLLWAASALAAILIGLVLPPSQRNLAAAWVCATVASLSKSEGFITACMILGLLAVRYIPRPVTPFAARRQKAEGVRRAVSIVWVHWAAKVVFFAVLMALPGLFWSGYVKYEKIGSDFVGMSGQSVALRSRATAPVLWGNLHVLPLAVGIALVGAVVLSRRRRQLALANDLWLWIVVTGSLAALVLTYVFGALEIHWWLSSSANRTTIFENLTAYGDMALWLTVAASYQADRAPAPEPASVEPFPEDTRDILEPTSFAFGATE